MPQTLRIDDVPDDLMDELKQRARLHRRSLEAEVVAALSDLLRGQPELLTPLDVVRYAQNAGLSTPREAVRMIREDRDAR